MARRLLGRGTGPVAIVCSPAERTLSTAILMARELGLSSESVSSDPELYFAGAPMLLRTVSLFDDEQQKMMIVGHNPAVTDFVNELGGLDIVHVPTSGIVQFELPIDRWQDVVLGQARCVEFDYPKRGETD